MAFGRKESRAELAILGRLMAHDQLAGPLLTLQTGVALATARTLVMFTTPSVPMTCALAARTAGTASATRSRPLPGCRYLSVNMDKHGSPSAAFLT